MKRINLPRGAICIAPFIVMAFPALLAAVSWKEILEDPSELYLILIPSLAAGCCWLAEALRRSVFDYRIYRHQAEMDIRRHYYKHLGTVFNVIAAILIILLLAVASVIGSVLFLIGPVVFMIYAALRATRLPPPPPTEHVITLPWEEYRYVTIDRVFRIIALQTDEEDIGFDARLPSKELFEQYLAFLRTVLPPSAQYREGIWWG
ncbi:hypothetical protein RRX38_00790 [Pseudomonas sp. DTU_2021_1001937_2_SI_NGA_ILE_001]|uniref:hypothetical protein n=1 Tax=Pseudomonas sp. DTU_2021_1001937_2_SI_NGA_ILE_001 TaxID=3077589 RepID=UPI0028FC1FBD|nr:hypothetical protein [Pseudomonas sp. DTU_2021_1001937_2_SI_NGA_ILE_001]WNW09740.1 hypothetical protein RRX38_00790 [Pseudomonas sp. DTU_2021_1001937_2_SI_NGA_ILE_001]